jgi:hypothetical protein
MAAALPPLEFALEGLGEPDQVLMHHTSAWWVAEFRGPVGRRMRALAGADTVLTGFNGHIPAAVVCQAIAMLNPSAHVTVAEPANVPVAKRPSVGNSCAAPVAETPQRREPLLEFAADVVGRFHSEAKPKASEAPAPKPRTAAVLEEGRVRLAIERAIKLKRRFGLLVACSYLREQGWNFELAHRILVQADPRKAEAV